MHLTNQKQLGITRNNAKKNVDISSQCHALIQWTLKHNDKNGNNQLLGFCYNKSSLKKRRSIEKLIQMTWEQLEEVNGKKPQLSKKVEAYKTKASRWKKS